MQAYAELVPPTAVTHAVGLPFLCAQSHNLVVAKTSLLQVFEIKSLPQLAPHYTNGDNIAQNGEREASLKQLVLVGEYPISGHITSLAAIKLQDSKSGGHGLLVAVKDAKFTLVEWDPENHGLSTVSIHYYESEHLKGSPWTPALSHLSTYLTVDPSHRCVALKFGQRHLAILPFQNETDLDLDDFDTQLDGASDAVQRRASMEESLGDRQTPYGSSFVLQLTALDPTILDPVDLAFLHEYREPTLGVLYGAKSPSKSIENERRDVIIFAAFTLDIAQRARTPLQSIIGLPSDLFKLVPLALPISGSLLIGTNEIVHVDQSGKVYAVAVNAFAKGQSSLQMSDQSDLDLKLEDALVHPIPNQPGSLLLVLSSGEFIILTFNMDGRSVSSIKINPVANPRATSRLGSGASCTASVDSDLVFLGSALVDSLLLQCSRSNVPQLSRKRSRADTVDYDLDEDSDEDVDDEDDLYGDIMPQKRTSSASSAGFQGDATFNSIDKLDNLLSLGETIIAPRKRRKVSNDTDQGPTRPDSLQLVVPTGCSHSGGVSLLTQQINFDKRKLAEVTNVDKIWSLQLQESQSHSAKAIHVTTQRIEGQVHSVLYTSTSKALGDKLTDTDFEHDTDTRHMDVLANGKRILQVTETEVKTYDADLKLSQMLPMEDEETESDLRVEHVSSIDPYLLVIRNDHSVALLKADSDGELEEMELTGPLASKEWISGSLHRWSTKGSEASLFLLSQIGSLYAFSVEDLSSPMYVAVDLCQLPQILTQERSFRRAVNPERITEILIADIGTQQHRSPYLALRNEFGDVEVYQPFHDDGGDLANINPKSLRWLKKSCDIPGHEHDEAETDQNIEQRRMRALEDICGYSTIFVPGQNASFLLKEPSSDIRAVRLDVLSVKDISSYPAQADGWDLLITDDSGIIYSARLPVHTTYGLTGWALRRMSLGVEVEGVAYHAPTSVFVIGTTNEVPMPDELYNHYSNDSKPSLRPDVLQSTLHILHPDISQTFGTFHFPNDTEHITSIQSVNLEVSQSTKERRALIAVGTSIDRGEDLPCLGSLFLFDIVQVAPDVQHPHPDTTRYKLRVFAHEEFRGPVTAICEAGSQGLIMAAQGQKVMVRGLRDDLPGQLLPVAFLDVACYVSCLRNLRGTGLSLIADALKGVQMAGFEATPYRLTSLSHSRTKLEVVTCDFLPHERSLLIVVVDADSNIHVLEYNPDNPKSVKGERLVHKSALHTSHQPTSSLLLPCPRNLSATEAEDEDDMDTDTTPQHALLLPTVSGAIIQITPLNESTYRRLSALQSHLSSVLPQPCAFNPREYRNVDSESLGYWGSAVDVSGRGMVDLGVVGRWRELGARGRREAWARVGGVDEVELAKAEIEGCRGGLFSGIL